MNGKEGTRREESVAQRVWHWCCVWGSGVAGKELWGVGGSVVVEVCGFLALAASEGVGWWW